MLSNKLDSEKDQLQKLSTELDARNKRLTELEKLLSQKDEAVNALRKKVSEALLGFEGQGLTVTKKNGKVYVSLEEKLLFKSGSIEVDPKGVAALKIPFWNVNKGVIRAEVYSTPTALAVPKNY